MKVLYLTCESLSIDPIISSQVIPLLTTIKAEANPTLLTFEPNGFDLGSNQANLKIKLCSLTKGKHLVNQLLLLRWLIKNGSQFDIMHVRSYLPMTMAVLYKLINNRIQLIFDPRGLYSEELEYNKGKNIFSVIFRRLERYFVRHSDMVIVVSKSMMSYFKIAHRGCENKIKVIPTFSQVPLKADSTQVPDIRKNKGWDSEILLCYSGSLEKWQCFDEILNIFSILQTRSSKFRFVFFSKNSKEMISRIEARLPQGSYSVYSADSEVLPAYLSQCDYGFLIRRPHLINKVAAPIKVKDYLLAGLHLVVTSDIGDTTEFLSDNNCGFTISYDKILSGTLDHIQLESRISPIEKKRISRVAANEFSLEVAAKRLLFLYSDLYEKNHVRSEQQS